MPKKLALAKVSAKPARLVVPLLADLRGLILAAREQVARAVGSGLVTLYWHVGRRVHPGHPQGEACGVLGEDCVRAGDTIEAGVRARVQCAKPLPHGAF